MSAVGCVTLRDHTLAGAPKWQRKTHGTSGEGNAVENAVTAEGPILCRMAGFLLLGFHSDEPDGKTK
jgi:hypothetical protein